MRATRIFLAATGLGIALIWVALAQPFPDIPGISLMGLALPAGLGVLLYAVILGSTRGPGLRALALLLGSALSFFIGTMVLWGGSIELVALAVALLILAVTEAIRAVLLRFQRGHAVDEVPPG